MSALIDNAEIRWSTSIYKYELQMLYGIKAGQSNFWKLYNIRMILDVLDWDDTTGYLTNDERDCLIGKLNHNLRTCNC